MSWDQFNRTNLTDDQYLRLAVILKEQELSIPQSEFTEHVLRLLEDVPGLELLCDSETDHIINKLWSLYHDQDQ